MIITIMKHLQVIDTFLVEKIITTDINTSKIITLCTMKRNLGGLA